jgi:hypothetical protein
LSSDELNDEEFIFGEDSEFLSDDVEDDYFNNCYNNNGNNNCGDIHTFADINIDTTTNINGISSPIINHPLPVISSTNISPPIINDTTTSKKANAAIKHGRFLHGIQLCKNEECVNIIKNINSKKFRGSTIYCSKYCSGRNHNISKKKTLFKLLIFHILIIFVIYCYTYIYTFIIDNLFIKLVQN